jgi:hypothetical protein
MKPGFITDLSENYDANDFFIDIDNLKPIPRVVIT